MNGKFQSKRVVRKSSKKMAALVLALVLTVGCVVGGTIAWLTSTTDEVTNTFTASDIEITLTESENLNLKMVPGCDITKDPKVTVAAGSEACWLFVEITEDLGAWADNKVDEEDPKFTDYLHYTVDGAWTALEGKTGVYYIKVDTIKADGYAVLTDNKVTVDGSVTKAMMDEIDGENEEQPTLTFKAYAIQQAKFDTAAAAWAEVSN